MGVRKADEQLGNGWVAGPADGKVAVGMGSQLGDGWAADRGREGGRDRWMHGWMDGETTS